MIKRTVIVLLLALSILGGLFGYKFYQIQQAISQAKPPPPAVVATTQVQSENWSAMITAVGGFTSVAGVHVSNEVPGKIKTLHFHSGQSVKQGQLLVELDDDTDQAELSGLRAELQLAKAELQRSEKMIERKYLSQSDYDQKKAQLEQMTAAVKAKLTRIEKKKIKAPFSGDLGIREVNVGQYLAEGADIISLQQLNPIHLDFTLPERYVSQLALKQTISATVQAYPGREFQGRIVAIDPALEADIRSIKVRAKLENPDKDLKPGMFAQIKIKSGADMPVLTLPDTAITYNPYGNAVFVIVKNDSGFTVKSRQVETGQSREGRVQILSGLELGDTVVSAGQVKLRNGMTVTISDQPASAGQELTP